MKKIFWTIHLISVMVMLQTTVASTTINHAFDILDGGITIPNSLIVMPTLPKFSLARGNNSVDTNITCYSCYGNESVCGDFSSLETESCNFGFGSNACWTLVRTVNGIPEISRGCFVTDKQCELAPERFLCNKGREFCSHCCTTDFCNTVYQPNSLSLHNLPSKLKLLSIVFFYVAHLM